MMSAIEWAEKYRPQSLKEIIGNKKAVQDLKAWAEEWLLRIPEKRAAILHGSAGVGKTSSVHALARDLGWELIELNASDQRTAGVIEKVAGSAASMDTLFGGKRLIVLDEADNIHGSADRGGMRAIAGLIKTTRQPIVLIANDVYGLTPTIRNLCLEIKFGAIQSRSMIPALKKVCESEGILCSPDAVQKIAENAGGDLRSAMNDLQAAASGKEVLEADDISTSGRDVKENIFKAMQRIFKSTNCKKALEVAFELDESPEDLVHWIDENLPIQYASKDGDLGDIRTGFEYLSEADLYLGRVKRRQNYRMWRYASMLMVCGAVISKTRPYPGFIKYQQPSLWRRLGQTRSKRDLRDNIASKIGEHSFESMRYSRNNLLELYSRMVKDERTAVEITASLELELEELIYLSGSTKPSKKLQKIYDEAQELLSEGREGEEEPDFFKTPIPSKNGKCVTSFSTVKSTEKEGKEEDKGKEEREEIEKEERLEKEKGIEKEEGLDKGQGTEEKRGRDGKVHGDSENFDFRLSEGKQRTLNFSFDTSSEIPGDNKTSESNTFNLVESNPSLSGTLTSGTESLDKKAPYLSESLEKKTLLGSETSVGKVSSGSPKDKIPAEVGLVENEPGIIKAPELKSSDIEAEAAETHKKSESKTQKTLFDF